MGTFAANNIVTWFGGYDMTGDLNQVTMPIEFEALDSTTFGPTRTARSRQAGLEDVSSQVAGFAQFGTGLVDEAAFNAVGKTVRIITHSHDGLEGSPAYFYQAREFSYQVFGDVGQLTPFSVTAQASKGNGSPGAIRGVVLKTKAAVSATGATGTSNQLGAVPSGQFLYAALHVFSAGTTITAVVESAPDNTFAAATTRATFGSITTTGGTWATRVAGPITDAWYRLRITAITGTFTIACLAGIKE